MNELVSGLMFNCFDLQRDVERKAPFSSKSDILAIFLLHMYILWLFRAMKPKTSSLEKK